MKKFTILLVIIISLLASAIVFSQTIPHTINYQGILKDASGVVVTNGDYELTFKLYDVETNGSALWTEKKTLTVTDGIVNTPLGSSTPVDLPFNKEYWLGIKVGTESELAPRIKLSAVPYSYMSMNVVDGSITADKIKSGEIVKSINSLTDDVTLVAGSNVSITPSGNNLTINSTASGGGLTLPYSGSASTGSEGSVFSITNTGADNSYAIFGSGFTGLFGHSQADNGRAIFGNHQGNGIGGGVYGVTNSSTGYGVYGRAAISGSNIGVKGEATSSTGYSGYFSGGKFYVDGLIGIGTTNPIYDIDIIGRVSAIRLKADSTNAAISLDRNSSGYYSDILFSTSGIPNYWMGTLGNDNFRISTSNGSLNGLQVSPSGDVNLSDNLFINGSIGLGITTAPTHKIDAAGNINLNKGLTGARQVILVNGYEALWFDGTYFSWGYGGTANYFRNKIFVGSAYQTPTQMLDVNGNARFRAIGSGAYYGVVNRTSDGTLTISSSDVRLKENIHTLRNSLDKVMKLRGVSFTWKTNPEYGTRIGFIAQEFEDVIPELVFTNESDGYKGINYAEVTAVLVEAMKELKAENDELKARLEKLEQYISQTAMK